MISPFMRLIRLNCLMKYQNLLFARTCGTRRPTLASARGDRRSARAFSPPRAACQTTALSFRKPGIPVHPRPGQSPGRQRRQLPRSAPLKMCGLEKARRRARTSSSANTFIRKILGFGFLSVGTCRPTTCHRCIPILPRCWAGVAAGLRRGRFLAKRQPKSNPQHSPPPPEVLCDLEERA